jgi:transcriptional regulator with XRE-family HTH domain
MSPEVLLLTFEVRDALVIGQRGLGELLGASRRTVQRWDSGRGGPSASQLAQLAAAIHPRDASLAAKIAAAAGTSLEQLGLVRPPPVAVPPVAKALALPAPSPPTHLTDAVVCAAAEALNAPPPAVRPVLLAAFRRAREVGLRVEDVEQALSDAIEKRRPKVGKGRR